MQSESKGTIDIGDRGEGLAAEYLTERGFEILERNWRAGRYEIDIIALYGSVLHIVEVKTRKRGGLTTPEDAITPNKFESLVKAAEEYIKQSGVDLEVQFDLIAVEYDTGRASVRYVPNAMLPRW